MKTARLRYTDVAELKEREVQILRLYLMRYSYRRMAEIVGVSYTRANQCIRTAKEKLNVSTFQELAEKAVELGIIAPDEVSDGI